MTRRSLLLLGGAAILAVGGAALLSPDRGAPPPAAAGALAFPGLTQRLAGATRIEVRKPDATLVVQREGERWVLPGKAGHPVRPERVRELLVGLTELRLIEPRTADPAQHARLGVDDPAAQGSSALLLRVLDAAGAPIAELVVGRRRVRTQGNLPESVYIRRPGEAQSWLAEGRLPVDADPQLWLDRDIANLPAARLLRLEARREGAEPVVLERPVDQPDAPLEVAAPPDLAPPLDEVALDEVSRAFEFLTFLDVRPAAEMPGTSLGEALVALTEGLTVTVHPQREGDALWIRLSAAGDTEEARRLAARWQGWTYQVGSWKEKAFLPRPDELRARERSGAPEPEEAPAEVLPHGHPALPRGPGR
jgi:hypothetical protein